MKIVIKKVDKDNINEVSKILTEAAKWLISANMKNWDPAKLTAEYIVKNNNLEEFYLFYVKNEAAGCLKLQKRDEMFWPDDSEGDSLYIHKLAVKRKFAKQGISIFMLNWAKEQAWKSNRCFLKLDCIANRNRLRNFYEMQGFIYVEERLIFGKYPTALFEYKVTK